MAGLLDSATLLPLISPPFTTSIAFVFSFGPRGFITHGVLGMTNAQVYGLRSTLVAESLTYFPLAYMALRPMLTAIGGNLEEMAFSLGSSRWRAFRTVTLKLTVPGLANAFLLLFAASLADFATPLILAGNDLPVLPTEAFLQITGMFDLKGGAVLSLLLLVPALIVFLLQRRLVARRSYVTLSGKGARATAGDSVTPKLRWALVLACMLVVLFIFYLYGLLAYASGVRAFGADGTPTLANYHVVFTQGLPAIRDTLFIGAIAMPLGGLYGVLVGSLVGRVRGGQALELVSMINYALPGTVVGIGYLVAFNTPPFLLTGTATIIIACYIFRYSPSGIRTTIALLAQIDRSIEEASTSLGGLHRIIELAGGLHHVALDLELVVLDQAEAGKSQQGGQTRRGLLIEEIGAALAQQDQVVGTDLADGGGQHGGRYGGVGLLGRGIGHPVSLLRTA